MDTAPGASDDSMAVVYGPAPKPADYESIETSSVQEPAELAESGLVTAPANSLAEQHGHQEPSGIPEIQEAVAPAALEPSEPAAPGMEPEGPMPSFEMQLIITKLAGFIQVGFHLAPATLPMRCPHLSLALASLGVTIA